MARKSSQAASGGHQFSASIAGPRILLLLSVFALLLLGLVMLYSASSIEAIAEGVSPANYLIKQVALGVVGIIGAFIIWKFIPHHVWRGRLLFIAWAVCVALLILTAIMGTVGGGAVRWVNLGPVSLQPSEFAKIAFVLMMARILCESREGTIDGRKAIVECLIFIVLPVLFLYQTQSDLGTTIICFVGILTVLWMGEVPLRYIAYIVGGALLFVVLASLVGYRQDRFLFLNPWNDGESGLGLGYQLIHSFYAFSEGGLFGVGLGNSREKFLYLPEAETDFIYAIIGEELGMIGALVVIALFLIFLYAGLQIARRAPDQLGVMIAGGCTVMIVFQAFLNIGCVIGVFPTTGKPLPFISSGGTSLIASLLMVGLILSVSEAADRPSVHEQRRQDLRIFKADSQSSSSYTSSRSTRTRMISYQEASQYQTQFKHNVRRPRQSPAVRGGDRRC